MLHLVPARTGSGGFYIYTLPGLPYRVDTFFGVVPGDHSITVPAGCYMQSPRLKREKKSVADAAPEGSNVMNTDWIFENQT
ncbi:hypothetical protein GGU45_004020 [Niabella hirudinis]